MNAWNYWSDEGVIRFIPIDNMNNYSIEFIDLTDEAVKSKEEINLLDELTNTSTKDMLKEIEKLVSRPLASKEMATYISWQKDFSFTPELILLLIQYCVSKGKSDYRYIEKVAISWHDSNIKTVEQAQSYIKKHEDKWIKFRKILSFLGMKDGDIMKPQEDMLNKWVCTYEFPVDVILRACEICCQRLNRADFKYIDAILTSWNKDGLKT